MSLAFKNTPAMEQKTQENTPAMKQKNIKNTYAMKQICIFAPEYYLFTSKLCLNEVLKKS